MALTVEYIHLVILGAVKTPLWVISHVGFEFVGVWKVIKPIAIDVKQGLSSYLSCLYVPNQVIVSQVVVMKKVNENLVVIDETAVDEGVRKLIYWHRVIVKTEHLVELYLLSLDFFFGSLLLTKDAHSKLAVVHVTCSKHIASRILDNFFYFDVGILMAAKFFVEHPLFCNHVMLGDV